MNQESVSGAFQVLDLRGTVHLSEEQKLATWTPVEPISEGKHTLHVGELLFSNGEVSKQRIEIPFFFINSKAQIPRNVIVYYLSRIAIDKLGTRRLPLDKPTRKKYIEIMKATRNRTDEVLKLAYDSEGNLVDSNKIFKEINDNRTRKFGKLHETLHAHLEKLRSNGQVDVSIGIRFRERESDDSEAFEKTSRISLFEIEERKQIEAAKKEFKKKLQRDFMPQKIKLERTAPVLYTTLTKKQINDVTRYPEVGRVFLHETGAIPDLNNSIAIANSDDVHSSGFKGSGIKVGVWEYIGPDQETIDDLDITEFYNLHPDTGWHATLTHAIIKNKEKDKPHGHAPSCDLYSADDMSTDALEWAVLDKECTVISQSFHRSTKDALSPTLSYDDALKDWLILHWPYPTIIQSAGNTHDKNDNIDPPEDEYVNHKGYNSLRVGNHDDTASTIADDSAFRNPSSTHADRELPELCANGNGDDVWAVGVHGGGTSFAAPAVAGAVALLQSIDKILKMWPEGCRALLLAGARINVRDNMWSEDLLLHHDAYDGTGALDAQESAEITKNRSKKDNTPATQRGWDIGTLTSDKFDEKGKLKFSYNVKVPGFGRSRHVKVALAWNSKFPQTDSSSVLTDDFDIWIFDNANKIAGRSISLDNSYEIAEFDGEPGEVYKIIVRKISGANIDWTWYGIAWTVF